MALAGTAKRVWLDTDPAIGVRFRDLDDGLAILMLLASPEVSLEGISINFGNVNADRGFAVAKEVLAVAGAKVPLFKGAGSRQELGRQNPAVEAMIKIAADNPGRISLLAIAPLTNVATAMILDPNFAANLRELVIMGGTLNFRPFSFFGEFNFHLGGRATQIALSAPIPKTLITMDVCRHVVFRQEHLDRIKQQDSAVGKYLARTIPSWLRFNRLVFRQPGFYPWDPIGVGYLLDPGLFEANPCAFQVTAEGWRRGRIVALEQCPDFEPRAGIIPINMPLKIDAGRFLDLLLARVLGSLGVRSKH